MSTERPAANFAIAHRYNAVPVEAAASPPPAANTREVSDVLPTTLLCLPTYNEAENIEALLAAILAGTTVDVLVIDDGSPDGTGEMVLRAAATQPRLRLLQRNGRLGLGTAYLAGFTHGLALGYDRYLTMDADFSHSPDRIPALLAALDQGADLAIGSRYVAEGKIVGWGRHRRVLSAGANAFAQLWLGLRARDCTSGFRCYRRPVVEYLVTSTMQAAGYSTLVEMLVRCERGGFKVAEVPITFVDRVHGDSKMSSQEIVDGILNVMSLARSLPRRQARPEPIPAAERP